MAPRQRPGIAWCLALLAACSAGAASDSTGSSGGSSQTPAYTGAFHSVAHTAAGSAAIYLTGGSAQLRLTSTFATQANPNLEVWLVAAPDETDNQGVLDAQHVSLGPLKSASGAQSYDIPSGVDLTQYRSVTVWCVEANVNFVTAPMTMP